MEILNIRCAMNFLFFHRGRLIMESEWKLPLTLSLINLFWTWVINLMSSYALFCFCSNSPLLFWLSRLLWQELPHRFPPRGNLFSLHLIDLHLKGIFCLHHSSHLNHCHSLNQSSFPFLSTLYVGTFVTVLSYSLLACQFGYFFPRAHQLFCNTSPDVAACS